MTFYTDTHGAACGERGGRMGNSKGKEKRCAFFPQGAAEQEPTVSVFPNLHSRKDRLTPAGIEVPGVNASIFSSYATYLTKRL